MKLRKWREIMRERRRGQSKNKELVKRTKGERGTTSKEEIQEGAKVYIKEERRKEIEKGR